MQVFKILIEKDYMLLKKSCSSQKFEVFIIKYYGISKIYSV